MAEFPTPPARLRRRRPDPLPPLDTPPPRGGPLPPLGQSAAREGALPPLIPIDRPRPNGANGDSGDLPPLGTRPRRPDRLPPLEAPLGAPPVEPPRRRRAVAAMPGGRRLRGGALAVACIAAAIAAGAVSGQLAAPGGSASPSASGTPAVSSKLAIQDAIAAVEPSVVLIRTGGGQGSGVVVAPQGLIITNQHVVQDASDVTITTADGRQISGAVVARDPNNDLAVIRPAGAAGPGATLADEPSGGLRLGDTVFAVGSPFGLQNTVTSGIVSALDRAGRGGQPLIQTDAPINPGNSGGGLFDLSARLVGIPTSIDSPNGANVGIGFAVPVERVRGLLAQVP